MLAMWRDASRRFTGVWLVPMSGRGLNGCAVQGALGQDPDQDPVVHGNKSIPMIPASKRGVFVGQQGLGTINCFR